MVIRGLLSVFVLLAASCGAALAEQSKQLSVLMISDTTIVAGRLMGDPIEKRWAVVQIQMVNMVRSSDKSVPRLTKEVVASIDCSNRGYERIGQMFNLESDPGMPPLWGIDPDSKKYENGINPRNIRHTPVEHFVKRDHEALVRQLEAADVAKLGYPGEHWPEYEILAVEFACAVVRKGMSESTAAEMIENTLGLNDMKKLLCRFAVQQGTTTRDVDWIVRFHDTAGYLKIGDQWKLTRKVTADRILAKHGDRDISINRFTGRAIVRAANGSEVQGTCEAFDGERKF